MIADAVYFAVAGIDPSDSGTAFLVETAFNGSAVGEHDAIVLVGNSAAGFVDQFDGDPVLFVRRNGLIGSGVRNGAAR